LHFLPSDLNSIGLRNTKESYSIFLNFDVHENFTERAAYFKFSCVLYANVPIICHSPLTENPITATRFGSYWVLFRLSIFCIKFENFSICTYNLAQPKDGLLGAGNCSYVKIH